MPRPSQFSLETIVLFGTLRMTARWRRAVPFFFSRHIKAETTVPSLPTGLCPVQQTLRFCLPERPAEFCCSRTSARRRAILATRYRLACLSLCFRIPTSFFPLAAFSKDGCCRQLLRAL